MTTTALGYNIPSSFKMIQSINNKQPKMLKVHQDEFNRINKKFDRNQILSTPYTDYIQMIYIKYILNKKEIKQTNIIVQPVHIGMKMLNNLSLT